MSQCQPSNQEKFWWKKYPVNRDYSNPRRLVDLERVEKQKELHRRRKEKFSKINK